MYYKEVVKKTEEYAKSVLSGAEGGHDWWHAYRVHNLARTIQKSEGGDLYIIEIAALLHDIADWKFHGGDETVGPGKARDFLKGNNVDDKVISHVCEIIKTISFKGAGVKTQMATLEGKIVQDADRLDGIGAMGIARTFAYGGSRGREMYNPDVKPEMHATSEQYKKSAGTSINHFYEKLLLLKDRMNTETAKKMAEQKHKFMEVYLAEFFKEWEGRT
jgi:uncharacterized protein